MVFEHVSYRSYLKALLLERAQRNPSYSLRAMAKQLGLVSSQLSEVMNGKANFSMTNALRIAKSIGLTEDESEYFCWLVQLQTESAPETRDEILKKLNKLRRARQQREVADLSVDQFKQIAEWYHSAILELVELDGFEFTPVAISQAIGITPLEAEVAIDRLARLELLVNVDGRWERIEEDVRVSSPTQNSALRSFYRQMMQKASEALETQTPSERVSGYETLTFSREALTEARAATDRFFDEMIRLSRKHPRKTRVYHLLVHFFDLTERKKEI